jgi:hypothetical protein
MFPALSTLQNSVFSTRPHVVSTHVTLTVSIYCGHTIPLLLDYVSETDPGYLSRYIEWATRLSIRVLISGRSNRFLLAQNHSGPLRPFIQWITGPSSGNKTAGTWRQLLTLYLVEIECEAMLGRPLPLPLTQCCPDRGNNRNHSLSTGLRKPWLAFTRPHVHSSMHHV